MRIWPDMLPGPILPGYSFTPYDQVRRTEMEGAVRARPTSNARRDLVEVPWLFTDTQFVLFRQWWGDEAISLLGDSDNLTGWTVAAASIVADAAVGPDLILADRLVDTAANAGHSAEKAYPGVIADNATLMARATIRAAGRGFARVQIISKAGLSQFATLDLASRALPFTSGVSLAEVTDRGGGWWRVTVRASAGTGGAAPLLRINAMATSGTLAYSGDGGSGIDFCEVQGRVSDGYDGFAHTDATGRALGAGRGAAWVRLPLAFGGGLQVVEARPTAMFRARPRKGLYWGVSCGFEMRNA